MTAVRKTKPAEKSATSMSARLRRGELLDANCPSRGVLKHVTSRWGVLILISLMEGTHRFSDLRRKIGGVSEKMLAETLQALEADGLIVRTAYQVMPPHVEYDLSALGAQAAQRVEALADWIEENVGLMLKARKQYESASQQSPNSRVVRVR
jgi:DNA-binding HxlR family transcriptional regulator